MKFNCEALCNPCTGKSPRISCICVPFKGNDKMIIETIIYLFDLTDTAVIESTNEKADLTLMPITGNVYSVAGGKHFS